MQIFDNDLQKRVAPLNEKRCGTCRKYRRNFEGHFNYCQKIGNYIPRGGLFWVSVVGCGIWESRKGSGSRELKS